MNVIRRTTSGRRLDGWSVAPLEIKRSHSSYFADREMFPADSIRFGCGLVMQNILHERETAAEMYL